MEVINLHQLMFFLDTSDKGILNFGWPKDLRFYKPVSKRVN